MQPNYEYHILRLDIDTPDIQDKLNHLGANGWELISYPNGDTAVFKRRQLSLTNLWSESSGDRQRPDA